MPRVGAIKNRIMRGLAVPDQPLFIRSLRRRQQDLLLSFPATMPKGPMYPFAEGRAFAVPRVGVERRCARRLWEMARRVVIELTLDVLRRDLGDLISVHEPPAVVGFHDHAVKEILSWNLKHLFQSSEMAACRGQHWNTEGHTLVRNRLSVIAHHGLLIDPS